MTGRMHRGWHGRGRGPGRGGWQQADLPGADDAAALALGAAARRLVHRGAGRHGGPRGDRRSSARCPPVEGEFAEGDAGGAERAAAEAGRISPVPRDHARGAHRDRPPGRAPLRPEGRVGRAGRRHRAALHRRLGAGDDAAAAARAGRARHARGRRAWPAPAPTRWPGRSGSSASTPTTGSPSCARPWRRSTTCAPRAPTATRQRG